MSRYKIRDQHGLNFVTLTLVDWVDVFTRYEYKEIVLDSFRFCIKNKGLQIFAYVIMTSHVHLVVKATGKQKLSDVLRDLKKHTAKTILDSIIKGNKESRREWLLAKFQYHARNSFGKRQHKVWQTDNHPIELYSLHVIAQKVAYIHDNPVKEGIVGTPEHYLYSSASNYAFGTGLLNVDVIDFPTSWEGYVPTIPMD